MNSLKIYTTSNLSRDLKWDSSFRLIFILKGNLFIHIGTSERHLFVHDFSFIKPFEIYGASQEQGNYHAFVIDIARELWENICPGADEMQFTVSILKSNDNQEAYKSICSALAQILYYNNSTERFAAARIFRAVSDILAILIAEFTSSIPVHRLTDQTTDRIQNILRYISLNYEHHFSLEDISSEIGFHPQYFSAYFKKQFGTNFTDYLNTYRVNKSIALLRENRESILNIALACGFNNHKTFNNAFEKVCGCTPREYRRRLLAEKDTSTSEYPEEEFEYIRRFWNQRSEKHDSINLSHDKCSISVLNDKVLWVNHAHSCVSVGRAISCLRSDMQNQLLRAKEEMNLEYVRIRDVFSDDLFVYYEDSNKTMVFSWRALDEIFDFMINNGLKPFIEIGYMPSQLASRKQYAGWQYHPNISAPKSMRQWEALVSGFISHLLYRYGNEEVRTWLFDFWTSPNLNMERGYWCESKELFFEFYAVTFQAAKNLDPQIRFGSPNFSYPSGFSWYTDFLKYISKRNITPDFISCHLYCVDDGQTQITKSFMEYSIFDNNYSIPRIKPKQDTIPRATGELKRLISEQGYPRLPIVIDDWNVSFYPTDYTRDTCFMAPFILDAYFNTCDKVYAMGFASFSDIHEDFFNTDQLYNGGPGLLTYNGIPKASCYAMSMAFRFPRRILRKGTNYIVGKTDTGYEILIYNLDFYNEGYTGNDSSLISFTERYNVFRGVHDLDCHIELAAQGGTYNIVRTLVSRRYGSSYDIWVRMGSPANMTREMTKYLRRISTPEMSCQIMNVSGNLILDEVLEPHSIVHLEISRL